MWAASAYYTDNMPCGGVPETTLTDGSGKCIALIEYGQRLTIGSSDANRVLVKNADGSNVADMVV